MLKEMEVLHHRETWSISGMVDLRAEDIEWEYPPVDDAMESVGICLIK